MRCALGVWQEPAFENDFESKASEAEMPLERIKSADYMSQEYGQSEIITRRSWVKDWLLGQS